MILDGAVNVVQGNVSLNVVQASPGLAVVRNSVAAVLSIIPTGSPGAQGAAATFGMILGGEDIVAGQIVSLGFALADAVPATAARSVAYTETPPQSLPVTVALLDNGTPFGTATWAVGAHLGILSFDAATAPFVRDDVPGFQLPNPLDAAFTQFTVTYAG